VTIRRFACTQCGKCCNRSPEVELSEAAALADVFVFRLMFRLYWLPQQLGDYLAFGGESAETGGAPAAAFYEKKRLLAAFAARKSAVKVRRGGKAVAYTRYLSLSALALDTKPGACAALDGSRCSIYERRPVGCRSVPFHYSRAEALAEAGLDAFVATEGYRCDTSASAPVVLDGGKVLAPPFAAARAQAIALAEQDRGWSDAIARRMSGGALTLPSIAHVEANAQYGATTVSMRAAWQVATDAGFIGQAECDRLVALQLTQIGRALAAPGPSSERETLAEMREEYRRHGNKHIASPAPAVIIGA